MSGGVWGVPRRCFLDSRHGLRCCNTKSLYTNPNGVILITCILFYQGPFLRRFLAKNAKHQVRCGGLRWTPILKILFSLVLYNGTTIESTWTFENHDWPKIAPYCSVFWPSLSSTVDPVKSLWFKMVCTCVPHIVLHVLSSTSTSGGYFRPQKSILTKIAIFGCFWREVYPPLGCHLGNIKTYTG